MSLGIHTRAVHEAPKQRVSANGLTTLPDSDSGTDSDSDSCPIRNSKEGLKSQSVQCEKFCIVQ